MAAQKSVATVYISLAFTAKGIESKIKSLLNEGVKKANLDDKIEKETKEGAREGVEKGVKEGGKTGSRNLKKNLSKAASGLSGAIKKGVGAGAKGAGRVGTGIGVGLLAGLGTSLAAGFKRLQTIESAKAQIAGLGKTAEQVTLTTDNALASVQGTAYAVTDATKAATLGLAAGLKEGPELENYLNRIADVAAVSGSDYSELSLIFGKIAAAGKVSAEELNQFNERGFGAGKALADYYKITQEEVRKMASKGQISADDFLKAMNAYEGAAKRSGDTTKGAIANMVTSFGRLGAVLLGGAFPIFQKAALEIRDVVDGITEVVKPSMDRISEEMGQSVISGIDGVGAKIAGFLMEHQSDIDKMLTGMWEGVKSLWSTLQDSINAMGVSPEEAWQGFVSLAEKVGEALLRAGELGIQLGIIVGQIGIGTIIAILDTFLAISDIVLPILQGIADWMNGLDEGTRETLGKILGAVIVITYAVSGIAAALGPVIGFVSSLVGLFGGAGVAAGATAGATAAAGTAAGGLAAAMGSTLGIIGLVVAAGLALGGIIAWLVESTIGWGNVFDAVGGFFSSMISGIVTGWNASIGFIVDMSNAIGDGFIGIGGAIADFFGGIFDFVYSGFQGVMDLIGQVQSFISSIGSFFSSTFNSIPNLFGGFSSFGIPAMATGGDVMGPTIALVGEKDPETIVNRGIVNENLVAQTRMIDFISSGGAPSGGRGNIINVYPSQRMSEEELARKVSRQLEWEGRGE